MITRFLDGNTNFVEKEFKKNKDYYAGIAQQQKPEILWIGCSDSRVSEDVITHSKPGSIFVHRNIANIVAFNDLNFAAILEFAINHLEIEDIVVCGHSGCGGIKALLEGVEQNYIADWLLIAQRAKDRVLALAEKKEMSREEKLDLLCEENVKLQIDHLKSYSLIRNLEKRGKAPRVHGWKYCLDTGKIKVLIDGKKTSS